jgi:uncharacterized membrane protein YhaH (DUF805 family)
MSFPEAIRSGFRLWSRTDGRASRSEYWWWVLFSLLVWLVPGLLLGIPSGPTRLGSTILSLVFLAAVIVLIVPTLTLSIRRLHDTDRSGWWLLIGLLPYIGGIILLILYCLDGSPGENQFGERPGGDLPGYRPPEPENPFMPTIRVPATGMPSWPTPDPAGPVTSLAAGLHLAVTHRVDDWAQVRASNGWVGWVDGRRLVPLAPPPPHDPIQTPPVPEPGSTAL